jgi:hypothetical protein
MSLIKSYRTTAEGVKVPAFYDPMYTQEEEQNGTLLKEAVEDVLTVIREEKAKNPEEFDERYASYFFKRMIPKIERLYKNMYLEPDGFEKALKRTRIRA